MSIAMGFAFNNHIRWVCHFFISSDIDDKIDNIFQTKYLLSIVSKFLEHAIHHLCPRNTDIFFFFRLGFLVVCFLNFIFWHIWLLVFINFTFEHTSQVRNLASILFDRWILFLSRWWRWGWLWLILNFFFFLFSLLLFSELFFFFLLINWSLFFLEFLLLLF